MYFSRVPDLWEKPRKIRNHEYDHLLKDGRFSLNTDMFWDYNHKGEGELFGLTALYRDMPKKDLIRGKKQTFEAVMMYWWTHDCVIDVETWEEYQSQLEARGY